VPDRHHLHNLAQNKVQNSGKFLDAKKRPSTHHDLPATHHNFTTTSPHENTFFLQNPLKNGPSTTQQKNTAQQKAGPHLHTKIKRLT
jgi:hypothetical protein